MVTQSSSIRRKVYQQMEPSARRHGLSPINFTIITLVLLSFLALALETEPTMSAGWKAAINVINIAIVIIFTVEYLARIWIAGEREQYRGIIGRLRYILSPYALADMIAFLPELLWLLFAPAGADDQFLTILRVLRLARLAKIARFVPAFDIFGATLKRAGGQLLTTLAMALALVYVAAVMLYFIEGVGQGRSEFASIPRAVWWAIATLTTVGYGDVYPVTTLGRIAGSVISLAGIGVVALPAGVFASAFSDELRARDAKKLESRLKHVEDEVEVHHHSEPQDAQE